MIRVFTHPADYEAAPPGGREDVVVVVFDILRATTSMVTAFAHGCPWIVPCATPDEARHQRSVFPGVKVGGERGGEKLEGFDFGNSPLEYARPGCAPEGLAMTTTNGTRALLAARGAKEVVVGSLLNIGAVAERVRPQAGPLWIFCAGTEEDFALEDGYAAGMLLARLDRNHPFRHLYEANRNDPVTLLTSARNGQRLVGKGRSADVAAAARIDSCPLVPVLRDGRVIPA